MSIEIFNNYPIAQSLGFLVQKPIVSALSGIIFAGVYNYFSTQKQEPAIVRGIMGSPEGERVIYLLRPGVCSELSDEDWNSMSFYEISTFREYLISHQCDSIAARLLSKASTVFREVAGKMGFPNSDQCSVTNFSEIREKDGAFSYSPMGISGHCTLSIDRETAYALNGWHTTSTPQLLQEIRGSFAHEAAHRILKHHERLIAFEIELHGIPVESLDDIKEVLNAWKEKPSKPPQGESAKRLYDALIHQNEPFKEKIREMAKSIRIVHEREADLLTLRDPELARGLRNDFVRLIDECSFDCVQHDRDTDTHPSTISRIQYLTDALCDEYPEENQDICPSSSIPPRSNLTCPLPNLSKEAPARGWV